MSTRGSASCQDVCTRLACTKRVKVSVIGISLSKQTAAASSSADLVFGNEVQASLRYVPAPLDAWLDEHAGCECFILVLHHLISLVLGLPCRLRVIV